MSTASSEDLGKVFESLRHSLLGYLHRQVRDRALAEDLLQDVFVKAMRAVNEGRMPSNFQGWLYAAAKTTAVDHYRATRSSAEPLLHDVPDIDGHEELRLHQQLAICLRPFVLQLPQLYRDALLAVDFEGRTMRELADQEGVSVSAIKSRVSRGRVMLRKKVLDCCHVEMSGGLVSDYYPRAQQSR